MFKYLMKGHAVFINSSSHSTNIICTTNGCILLKNIVEEIEIHNQPFTSNLVWLNLIPVFNIFWSFYMNQKISLAIKNQLEENEQPQFGDYGMLLEKSYPLLLFATLIIWIPGIRLLLILSSVICLLMFWSKMSECYQKLKNTRRTIDFRRSAVNSNPDLLD